MKVHTFRVGGGEKGYHFGGEVAPFQGSRSESAFPCSQRCCSERPGAVKGAPLLGAAERTLDGEDRSEMIAEEGKAGRKVGEKWSAKMVPSLAASNTPPLTSRFSNERPLDINVRRR